MGRGDAGPPRGRGRGGAALRQGARGRARGAAGRRGPRRGRRRGAPRPTSSSTASSASAGDPGCGRRPRRRWRASPGCPSSRSTSPPGSTSTPDGSTDAHVRADLTVTFGTHKIAHLVDPAAQACGVVHLVDIGLDLPAAPVEALQPVDVAALLPVPGPFDHKYTRGVVGVRAGSETYPGAAVLCTSGAVVRAGRDGALPGLGRRRRPRPAPGDRRRRGPGAGLGGRLGRRRRRRAGARRRPRRRGADGGRRRRACVHVASARRRASCSPRTPASWRACSASSATRSRPTSSASPAAPRRSTTPWCCSRAGAPWSPDPDGRVRVTTSGVPWLAVAGAGDVLAGVIGSLLAAGLDPCDAASVGSWLHGAAAARGQRRRSADARAPWPTPYRRSCETCCAELNGTMRRPMPARPPSPHAEIVVDLGAIRHNVRAAARAGRRRVAPTAGQLMVVVKADGYGHGMVPVARAARAAGAEWLGVATGEEALALRAAGDTGRVLCWLAAPGADFAPLVAGRRRRDRLLRRPARRRSSAAARRGRAARAGAAEVRHRPLPRRRARGEWLALVTAARARRGRGRGPGHRALVALRLRRRARPPRQRRAAAGLRRGAARWPRTPGLDPEVRHLANSAGALLHPDGAARPRPAGHRHLRPQPGPGRRSRRGARAGPGDDGARDRRTHQGAGGRRRRLLRTHVRRDASRCGWRWCRWGTATASRGTPRRPAEVARRRSARHGAGPDLHGPVRRRAPREAARRRRGGAVRPRGLTASRPRPTGRAGAARSTTRSSPGWVAGRPASGSGTRTR